MRGKIQIRGIFAKPIKALQSRWGQYGVLSRIFGKKPEILHNKGKDMDKKKVGRPKSEINYEEVYDLASIFCTQQEIASVLHLDRSTLLRDEKFCDIYKEGLDVAKMSIRRAQRKSALGGNVTMLIWLGKQYLGQRESLPTEQVEADSMLERMANALENAVKIKE